MARAVQGKWFADVLISRSMGYRSVDAVSIAAGAALQPGVLLTAPGAGGSTVAGTVAAVQHILLEGMSARTAAMAALVLSRDAEVNDAYILYGGLNVGQVNDRLRDTLNIVVRSGVLATSEAVPGSMDFGEDAAAASANDPPEPVTA